MEATLVDGVRPNAPLAPERSGGVFLRPISVAPCDWSSTSQLDRRSAGEGLAYLVAGFSRPAKSA